MCQKIILNSWKYLNLHQNEFTSIYSRTFEITSAYNFILHIFHYQISQMFLLQLLCHLEHKTYVPACVAKQNSVPLTEIETQEKYATNLGR
jgi:hypothetical protein